MRGKGKPCHHLHRELFAVVRVGIAVVRRELEELLAWEPGGTGKRAKVFRRRRVEGGRPQHTYLVISRHPDPIVPLLFGPLLFRLEVLVSLPFGLFGPALTRLDRRLRGAYASLVV